MPTFNLEANPLWVENVLNRKTVTSIFPKVSQGNLVSEILNYEKHI
jgi:hypothetical protein